MTTDYGKHPSFTNRKILHMQLVAKLSKFNSAGSLQQFGVNRPPEPQNEREVHMNDRFTTSYCTVYNIQYILVTMITFVFSLLSQ